MKSPHYWDRDHVRLREVVFHSMPDYAVAERAFRTGQLHVTPLNIEKAEAYRNAPGRAPVLHESAGLTSLYYYLNCARPPLNDVRVRRALSLAIDREQLARNVLRRGEAAAFSLVPPNCGEYVAERTVKTDVSEARRLLAEAGFPNGRGLRRLELLWAEYLPGQGLLNEALQQVWKSTLGIEIAVAKQEAKVAIAAAQAGSYDIEAGGWIPDYLDPTTYFDVLHSTNGNNVTRWASPEYDALLAEAMRTLDPVKRHAVLRRAEALMLGEVPIIVIFYLPTREIRHPTVKGWHANPLELHPLKYVYLEK